MSGSRETPHRRAADAFVRRVRERYGDAIERVLLYGSVARHEELGIDSDVDLLLVLGDDVDTAAYEERIRDLAYDVELEYGVILSLVVLSASEYESRADRPFFEHVRRDAKTLYG